MIVFSGMSGSAWDSWKAPLVDAEEDVACEAVIGMIGPTGRPSSRASRRLSPGCCTRGGEASRLAGAIERSSSIGTSLDCTMGAEDDDDDDDED